MSIIADTLTRLQNHTSRLETPPDHQRSETTYQHDHTRDSAHRLIPKKNMLLVGLGLLIGLGSIGIVGFWIGWHLDMEFPSNLSSSPRTVENSDSTTPLIPKHSEAPPTEPPVETLALNHQAEEPKLSAAPSLPASQKPPHAHDITPTVPNISSPIHQSDNPIGTTSTPRTTPNAVLLHTPENDSGATPEANSSIQERAEQRPVSSEDSLSPSPRLTSSLFEESITEDPIAREATKEEEASPPITMSEESQKARAESQMVLKEEKNPPGLQEETRLREARHLIREGRYEDALSLLSPLFLTPPANWEPWFWMGTAYLGTGNLEEADQFFLSGLARNDKIPQLWIQRALVAQQQGEYQLAIHELRQAEALQSDLPHIHLNMGYAYDQLGNERLANQYYGKFLQLTDGNPDFFGTRKKLLARLTQPNPSRTPSTP